MQSEHNQRLTNLKIRIQAEKQRHPQEMDALLAEIDSLLPAPARISIPGGLEARRDFYRDLLGDGKKRPTAN